MKHIFGIFCIIVPLDQLFICILSCWDHTSGWLPVPWRKSSSDHVLHDLPVENLLILASKNWVELLLFFLDKSLEKGVIQKSYMPKPSIGTVVSVLGWYGAQKNQSSGWGGSVWRQYKHFKEINYCIFNLLVFSINRILLKPTVLMIHY